MNPKPLLIVSMVRTVEIGWLFIIIYSLHASKSVIYKLGMYFILVKSSPSARYREKISNRHSVYPRDEFSPL